MTHLIDDFCCMGCCAVATTLAVVKIIKSEFSDSESEAAADAKGSVLLRAIEHYQKDIAPDLKRRRGIERICRYTPSCSQYAKEAILSAMAGTILFRSIASNVFHNIVSHNIVSNSSSSGS